MQTDTEICRGTQRHAERHTEICRQTQTHIVTHNIIEKKEKATVELRQFCALVLIRLLLVFLRS